jgi:DNA-binding IclR family transcriptional regulator
LQNRWDTVCLAHEEGDFPLRSQVLMPGDRYPLGVGAAGLALLAAMPDDEVEKALAVNAEILCSKYPEFSPDALRKMVTMTREQGYAVNKGMVVAGSWGLAIAVQDTRGGIPAAITIAAIESRFQGGRLEQLVKMLQEEKQALEARLQGTGNTVSNANKANGKLRPVKAS